MQINSVGNNCFVMTLFIISDNATNMYKVNGRIYKGKQLYNSEGITNTRKKKAFLTGVNSVLAFVCSMCRFEYVFV